MTRIARYGHMTAREGHGDEVAQILLDAAEKLASNPGCELYLINRERENPDAIWVTELWRSQADLDEVAAQVRSDPGAARVMELVADFEVVELELLGGKGP